MFPELPIESRQRHRGGCRHDEASVRSRRSRHHDQQHRACARISPGGDHHAALHAVEEIADDVADARVYGGIHWRTDQLGGNVLGRAIATAVVKNNLRPVHP